MTVRRAVRRRCDRKVGSLNCCAVIFACTQGRKGAHAWRHEGRCNRHRRTASVPAIYKPTEATASSREAEDRRDVRSHEEVTLLLLLLVLLMTRDVGASVAGEEDDLIVDMAV